MREYLNSVVDPIDDSPEYFDPISEISKELRRIEKGSLPEFYGALTESERKKYDPKGLLIKEVGKILKHHNRKN